MVFPTYVGMIPRQHSTPDSIIRIPHVCRDDPGTHLLIDGSTVYSPRM